MDQSGVQTDIKARWPTNNFEVELSYKEYGMNTYNNTCRDCQLLGEWGIFAKKQS